MPYLIDGHNLVPKIGLRLDAMDDEMELIGILQEFGKREQKQIYVFFDGAPQAGTREFGAVTATFVKLGSTADQAIRTRLKRLGKAARNWTVVSSDRQVQAEARAAHAEVISSEVFAARLKEAREAAPKPPLEKRLTAQEIEEWLKVFSEQNPNKKSDK